MDEIRKYREEQKRKYEAIKKIERVKDKYTGMFEFNKHKLSNYRIVKFLRKKYLKEPINLSEKELRDIPSIYRFRCYAYDIDDEIKSIKEMFDIERTNIQINESVPLMRKRALEDLDIQEKIHLCELIHSSHANKIYVIIDLRIYGAFNDIPFTFMGKVYHFNELTRQKITKAFNKIKPDSYVGDRFQQFIAFTRAIVKTYVNDSSRME